jgi:hypothetical protein
MDRLLCTVCNQPNCNKVDCHFIHSYYTEAQITDNKNLTSGNRFNEGKPELSQNPPEALLAAARVWMYGADKYGRYNWRKGGEKLSYMSILDSLDRHMKQFQLGQDLDEESQLAHTSHILCNAMMLSTFFETKTGVDDRYHGQNNQTSK